MECDRELNVPFSWGHKRFSADLRQITAELLALSHRTGQSPFRSSYSANSWEGVSRNSDPRQHLYYSKYCVCYQLKNIFCVLFCKKLFKKLKALLLVIKGNIQRHKIVAGQRWLTVYVAVVQRKHVKYCQFTYYIQNRPQMALRDYWLNFQGEAVLAWCLQGTA